MGLTFQGDHQAAGGGLIGVAASGLRPELEVKAAKQLIWQRIGPRCGGLDARDFDENADLVVERHECAAWRVANLESDRSGGPGSRGKDGAAGIVGHTDDVREGGVDGDSGGNG
jgi:hypothetical protein